MQVMLSSLQHPANVITLGLDEAEPAADTKTIPDWCPTESCFALGDNIFSVDNNTGIFSNCFIDGYRKGVFKKDINKLQPKCAKGASVVFNETHGFIWNSNNMVDMETCTASGNDPCPHQIPKGCPAPECVQGSLPWGDPQVPGLIHHGCSYASGDAVFGQTSLRCPKKESVQIFEDAIHVDTSTDMESCDEVTDPEIPCSSPIPIMMELKKAKKRNQEKSHQFQVEECSDGLQFLAMDNKSESVLDMYLVFDGSYLSDSYNLMREYTMEAMADISKACFKVTDGLCGPNSISLSPPDHEELLLTDCGDKLHFRRENDFCESKLSQCWSAAIVELDEDVAEAKFLVTPLEGRVFADTDEELAEVLEARIREKGFEEIAKFSAPTVLWVTCEGDNMWTFDDSSLKDADVTTDLMKLPCMSTHVCVAPPQIFIADPPLDTKAKLTETTPGVLVKYECQPDFLFDNKKDFPPEVEGSCTNQTVFDGLFPYWVIPGIEYPSINDLKCLNTKICKNIPQVRVLLSPIPSLGRGCHG